MNIKKNLICASIISLLLAPNTFAADHNITTEAELLELIDNDTIGDVGSGDTIIFDNELSLTSNKVLLDTSFNINGNGFTLNTNGFNFTKLNNTSIIQFSNLNFNSNGNKLPGFGGALYAFNGPTIKLLTDTTFQNIYSSHGGAIAALDNSSVLLLAKSVFNNNKALGGGALYSTSSNLILSDYAIFNSNIAETQDGGAIYNSASNIILNDGARFINNTSAANGGAIFSFNGGRNTLIARTNNIEFTGNTASGQGNGVFLENNSILNLNASNIANITFNDNIVSSANGNTININKTGDWNGDIATLGASSTKIPVDAPTSGEIILNADMSGFDNSGALWGNKVNFYNGTLTLGTNGVFFTNPDFNAYSGSTLNLINNKIDTLSLKTANINNMNMKIDVDLLAGTSDNISATTIDTNNTINITDINVITDKTGDTNVAVDPENKFNITLDNNATTINGPVYTYEVSNNGDGTLLFDGPELNPTTQAPTVVQQTAVANLAIASNIAFNRVDDVMTIIDNIYMNSGISYDNNNKIAALEGEAEYSTLYGRLEEGQAWFRPFSNIENISLDTIKGHVNSTSYGMVVGYDSPLKKLKRGYKRMFSAFGGYSGAKQDFENVNLYQNGGFVGGLMALYKKNFFASISTSVGGMGVVENIDNYGSSNYGMLTTSLGTKLGYNLHLTDNTTIQLNGQMGYNFVNAQKHTNAQGARIESNPLHIIQVTPGFKLSHRCKDWNVYLSSNMTFNPLNESKVTANDVVLPNSKLGEYVEYGLGIERIDTNKINGFMQAMVRNGSRTGVSLQFGVKIPTGKKTESL